MILHRLQKVRNSTIFKTYENDLDGISNKLGFSKRSFAEWGTQIKTSFNEGTTYIEMFKNALHAMLVAQSSKNNDSWLRTDAGEIVTKDNIDSFISKLDTDSARAELENLQNIQNKINEAKGSWDDYNSQFQNGRRYLLDYSKSNNVLEASVDNVKEANQQAREAAITHNAALQQQTLGCKAATVATKALAVAGNMLLMWGISEVISLAYNAIDNYIHRTDNLKEAAEEAKSSISNIKSEFDTLKSTTNDVKERFAELAQGVENLGKVNQSRGTLSTDDYNEFLDLSNQLAELFPQLTKGYDDNGNAILDLSGNVDTIVGSLDNMVSAQQKLANQQILEEMPDVWAGYTVDMDEYTEQLEDAESSVKSYQEALNKLSNMSGDTKIKVTSSSVQQSLIRAAKSIGLDNGKKVGNSLSALYSENRSYSGKGPSKFKSAEWDFSSLTESQIEQLKNELGSLASEYEDTVMFTKDQIASANSEMSSYINTWLSTDAGAKWNFSQMGSEMQNVVKDVLTNSDWISQLPDDIDTSNWDEVSNWLQQEFLYAINNIDSEEIQTALIDAFNDSISVQSLQKVISQLITTKGFQQDNPLIIYLQTKLNDTQQLTDDFTNRIATARGIDLETDLDGKRIIESFTSQFEAEELTILMDAEIPDDAKDWLLDDWQNWANTHIDDFKISASIEDDLPLSIDIASSIDSVQSALDDLYTALADYEENGLTGLDISNLTGLNNDSTFGNIDGSTKSYEKFLSVMQDVNATAEDVHNAFDTLASDYIYHSDLAQQITEDNRDYISSLLEKNGIINASAVAEQMMINKYGVEQTAMNECINANLMYANQKISSSNASTILANCTVQEIDTLIGEANAAGQTASALVLYELDKIKASKNTIYTDGDIANLLGLCEALKVSTDLVTSYIEVKNNLAKALENPSISSNQIIAMQQQADSLFNQIQNRLISGAKANTTSDSISTSTSTTSGSTASASAADEARTTINWAERRLSAISQLVDDIKDSISHLSDFNTQNDALNKAFRQLQSNLGIQKSAYDKYMEYANAQYNTLVKLYGSTQANNIKNAIADGTILISEYKSDAADIIQTYIDWYDKAQDVLDTMQDTKDELYEINQMKLDNIKEMYDIITSLHDTRISEVQASLDYRDAAGGSLINQTQADLYKKQLEETQYHLKKIEEEKAAYSKELEAQYKSGYISGADYQEGLTYLSELNAQIWQLKTSAVEYQQAIDSIDLKALEIEADTYQNLYDRWEAVISLAAAKKSLLTTEDGAVASAYRHQIEETGHQLQNLEKQLAWYQSALKNVSYGSQLWTDYSAEIADIQVQINDTLADQESLYDELIQLELNGYDKLTGKLDAYKSALTGLEGLLADEMLLTDDGHLTGYGIAKLTMLSEQYDVLNDQIKTYSDELKQIDEMYADRQDGYSEDEYLEDRQTSVNSILSSMSEMQSLTSDLITLRKSQMDKELSALEAVIAAREEAYEKKKEYYDYDKSIRTKTKDIQSIEAQIAALQATEDSLEKRRQLLALQEELKDAQTDLSETQTEHTYTVIVEGLDTFKNDLSDQYDAQIQTLKSSFEAQRKMIDEVTNLWASCGGIVNDVIKQIGTFYGVDISQYTSDTGFEDLAGFAGGGIIRSNRKTTGDRLLVRVNPLETILTEDFTKLLPDAVAVMSEFIKPNITLPDYNNIQIRPTEPMVFNQTIEALNFNVTGNADKHTVADIKKMVPSLTKQIASELAKDFHKSGW